MSNWRLICEDEIKEWNEKDIPEQVTDASVLFFIQANKFLGTQISVEQMLVGDVFSSVSYLVKEEVFFQAGGWNRKLQALRGYELLLRIARMDEIRYGYISPDALENQLFSIEDASFQKKQSYNISEFEAKAYLLSRYSNELKKMGVFEQQLQKMVEFTRQSDNSQIYLQFLEEIISKKGYYQDLYRETLPVLILKGENFCYNVLNQMADGMKAGFLSYGKQVVMYDLQQEGTGRIGELIGKSFYAVLGFQSFLSSIYLKENQAYLADYMDAPKYEMLLDHPFWFTKQLQHHGKEFFVLTHDSNYAAFVKRYGKDIAGCYQFVPGGFSHSRALQLAKRDRDVVFLGTYNNYRSILQALYVSKPTVRHMAAGYLKYLKKYVNKPAEFAFAKMLEDYRIQINNEQFSDFMYQMGNVCQCMMYYYREKIVKTLLDNQVSLHVFGSTWSNSPFASNPNLIQHEEILAEENHEILEQAKISLNVMAWHKGGFTERIVNSMLCGAVVISDKSEYLETHFTNGNELAWFDLEHLEKLPELINQILADDLKRQKMACTAFDYAAKHYVWEERVRKFCEIVDLKE